MMECTLESGHCHSLHKPKITKQHQKYSSSLHCVHLTNFIAATIPHGTDECDVCGLAVQHGLVRVDPQAGHLGQHVDHLHTRRQHHKDLGCGVAQTGCGVAQIVARRLAVRQARVRISAQRMQ
jgi:hypothetical protein